MDMKHFFYVVVPSILLVLSVIYTYRPELWKMSYSAYKEQKAVEGQMSSDVIVGGSEVYVEGDDDEVTKEDENSSLGEEVVDEGE
jgi:hypothetical protein